MQKEGDWIPLIDEAVTSSTTTSDKPSWLTTSISSAGVADFSISTNDLTAYEDAIRTGLHLPVQYRFRATTRDRWSGASVTKAFTVTFKHECEGGSL